MAGNQVLEWADLDTEIKTAGVKSVRTVVRYGFMEATDKIYTRTLWPLLICESF